MDAQALLVDALELLVVVLEIAGRILVHRVEKSAFFELVLGAGSSWNLSPHDAR